MFTFLITSLTVTQHQVTHHCHGFHSDAGVSCASGFRRGSTLNQSHKLESTVCNLNVHRGYKRNQCLF